MTLPSPAAGTPELRAAAEHLRAVVDGLSAALGSSPTVVRDTAQDCDPERPDRSFRWLYQVRATRGADADTDLEQCSARLADDGWRTTDRSTEVMHALQAERDGVDLGVTMATAEGGDVIVGGSTACVPAAEPG